MLCRRRWEPSALWISRDTLLRLVKAQGATVIAQNLQRRDVKVLAVDDVNLRKGDASTACSVFIDRPPRAG